MKTPPDADAEYDALFSYVMFRRYRHTRDAQLILLGDALLLGGILSFGVVIYWGLFLPAQEGIVSF
jgi:hypothetical protein